MQNQYKNLSKLQKSMLPDSAHDYLVRAIRIIFPMVIVALITFLILTPLTVNDEFSFVLAKENVGVAPERLRVTDALYRGHDGKGRPFSLKAGSAVQKSSDVPILDMEDFVGRIILNSGPAILSGKRGSYNLDSEVMRVNGPLQYESQAGNEFTASNVEIRLRNQNFESFDKVKGKTEFGTFNADKLRGALGTREIMLSGNVFGTTKFGNYRADKVTGDLSSRTVILEGNVRLTANVR